ncbi:MAG: AAA family ATPase [Candidatus Hodgkinia cicadicola]
MVSKRALSPKRKIFPFNMSRNLTAAALASLSSIPDTKVNLKSTFGLNNMAFIPSFSRRTPLVPQPIPNFHFNRSATSCILFGLLYNKRVLLVGEHGSGKSTLIEQVCSKLNWPCVRLNLDEHLTKLDFITSAPADACLSLSFKYGLLPWAMKRPLALILNASGALKPEAMIMLNKLLKTKCTLSPPLSGATINPNASFRLFATCTSTSDTFQTAITHCDGWQLVANLPTRKSTIAPLPASVVLKLKAVYNLLRKLKTKPTFALTCQMSHSWDELRFMFNNAHDAFFTDLRRSPCTPSLANTFGPILRGASFYSKTALVSAVHCAFR